jgi:hypothetical protein
MRAALIVFLTFCCLTGASAQQCNVQLPHEVEWKGSTSGSSLWAASDSDNITIDSLTAQSFEISDLSAGFFESRNIPYAIKTILEFDCDSTIVAKTIHTDFGSCEIQSGFWDANLLKLTINWSIQKNNVQETSTFIIK